MTQRTEVCLVLVGIVAGCLLDLACGAPAGAPALNRGSELFNKGRFEEAINEYRQAIAADHSWAPPYLGLGNALWATGNKVEALDAYHKAVDRSPAWIEANVALTDALLEMRLWDEVVRTVATAQSVRGVEDPELTFRSAAALTELDRNEEAADAFDHATKLCTCLDPRFRDSYQKAKAKAKISIRGGQR
jgi:tetratricopeptide (TPR) repeat protein